MVVSQAYATWRQLTVEVADNVVNARRLAKQRLNVTSALASPLLSSEAGHAAATRLQERARRTKKGSVH